MINYDSSFSNRLLHERPADLVGLAWLESNRIGVNRMDRRNTRAMKALEVFTIDIDGAGIATTRGFNSNTLTIVYVISEESRVCTEQWTRTRLHSIFV